MKITSSKKSKVLTSKNTLKNLFTKKIINQNFTIIKITKNYINNKNQKFYTMKITLSKKKKKKKFTIKDLPKINFIKKKIKKLTS